jgi:hypothetical protein
MDGGGCGLTPNVRSSESLVFFILFDVDACHVELCLKDHISKQRNNKQHHGNVFAAGAVGQRSIRQQKINPDLTIIPGTRDSAAE